MLYQILASVALVENSLCTLWKTNVKNPLAFEDGMGKNLFFFKFVLQESLKAELCPVEQVLLWELGITSFSQPSRTGFWTQGVGRKTTVYFSKAVGFSDHNFSKIKAIIFVDLVISHKGLTKNLCKFICVWTTSCVCSWRNLHLRSGELCDFFIGLLELLLFRRQKPQILWAWLPIMCCCRDAHKTDLTGKRWSLNWRRCTA